MSEKKSDNSSHFNDRRDQYTQDQYSLCVHYYRLSTLITIVRVLYFATGYFAKHLISQAVTEENKWPSNAIIVAHDSRYSTKATL